MRRLLSALALALTLLLPAASAAPPPYAASRASVVQILELVDGDVVGSCSGAVVALPRGPRVVSAGHCVEDNPGGTFVAIDASGARRPLTLEAFAHDGRKVDHAIFAAPPGLPALRVASAFLRPGDALFLWASPQGLAPLLFTGIFAGELHDPADPDLEVLIGGALYSTVNADVGASGAVVLNERGEAVAILVAVPPGRLSGSVLVRLPGAR